MFDIAFSLSLFSNTNSQISMSEEEQFSRDGGESEEVEEEEHRTRRHRQTSGGESAETAGSQPESGACTIIQPHMM